MKKEALVEKTSIPVDEAEGTFCVTKREDRDKWIFGIENFHFCKTEMIKPKSNAVDPNDPAL
jgi:hypothetical protein